MKKQLSVSKLKKKLDTIFSRYIRLKDCLDTTGSIEWGYCYTCKKSKNFKELQAGHYVDRTHIRTRYDERNVHPQCVHCNYFLEGNKSAYTLHLIKDYGKNIIKELDTLKNKRGGLSWVELDEMVKHYKPKVKTMEGL